MIVLLHLTEKALQYAEVKHERQYRKGKNVPYIMHPVDIVVLLKGEKYCVAAGLLHDFQRNTCYYD